jgi:levanase/fructan beta-fructosidase
MNTPDEAVCRFRPERHYAARRNWLNDPNGLVYANGLYHLFYQYNPYGNGWGHMSWGHATSPDLVTWEEHPVAIACDDQEMIYSGSAVIDIRNTSGFGTTDKPAMVAVYTSAYTEASPLAGKQAQSLAYSLDEGISWTKYSANPVLDRGSANFRDPKVFWYEGPAGSYWVMAAVEAVDRTVVLYRSSDLKSWQYLSAFGPANATGGDWECPDLFELPVDGDPSQTKWVLVVNLNPGGIAGGSAAQYFLGQFDGVTFVSGTTLTDGLQTDDSRMPEYGWLDWGRDYYAAVSFNNVPGGRRLMIGWMNNWQYAARTPTTGWRSAMSLAREVRLATRGGRTVLLQEAVEPPEAAGPNVLSLGRQPLKAGTTWLPAEVSGPVLRIDADFEPGEAGEIGLLLRAGEKERTVLSYDCGTGTLRVDRRQSGCVGFDSTFPSVESAAVPLDQGRLRLSVYLDRSSVEVFAQEGLVTITDQVFPDKDSLGLAIFASREGTTLTALSISDYNTSVQPEAAAHAGAVASAPRLIQPKLK